MEKILKELFKQQNIRTNLSDLRKLAKNDSVKVELQSAIAEHNQLFFDFLKNEDAKTRKNAALLLGDVAYQPAANALYEAYVAEETLFVRASYLQALAELDVEEKLDELKKCLDALHAEKPTMENKKHVEEEIRALRAIIIGYEGINHHTADLVGKKVSVILFTNRSQRETVRRTIDCGKATIHPLGVHVETENLPELMKLRTYREMVFPLNIESFLPANPIECAKAIWDSDIMEVLNNLHIEAGNYYFRIECKSSMSLEERSIFTKKLAAELESLSKGDLINSTSDYEVELRLIATRKGNFSQFYCFLQSKTTALLIAKMPLPHPFILQRQP